VSSTQYLDDVDVEDLLWNSLDGNVLKQRVKDGSLEDLLPQMGKLAGLGFSYPPQPILSPRRRLYPPGRSPLRDGVEPEAIVKNEAEGPFPILRGFIHSEIMAGERS
jgi:hypothetical protein